MQSQRFAFISTALTIGLLTAATFAQGPASMSVAVEESYRLPHLLRTDVHDRDDPPAVFPPRPEAEAFRPLAPEPTPFTIEPGRLAI